MGNGELETCVPAKGMSSRQISSKWNSSPKISFVDFSSEEADGEGRGAVSLEECILER